MRLCKIRYYLVVQIAQSVFRFANRESVFSDDLTNSSIWCSSTRAFVVLCHSTQILGMYRSCCCTQRGGCEQRLFVRTQGCCWILLQGGPFISEWLLGCRCSLKQGDISDAGNSWRSIAAETGRSSSVQVSGQQWGWLVRPCSGLLLHVPSFSSCSHPTVLLLPPKDLVFIPNCCREG